MSEVQTICALIHEISHAKLHDIHIASDDGTLYEDALLFGKPVLYSEERISPGKIPEGLFSYDLRASDPDSCIPNEIENFVADFDDYAGTVLTTFPIDLGESDCRSLSGDDRLGFTGEESTLSQYLAANKKDNRTMEIEAESIAYSVCSYYGIDTSENSLGYIAAWSKTKDLKELRESLETISAASSSLISDIDRHFAEICAERGISREASGDMSEIAVSQTHENHNMPEHSPWGKVQNSFEVCPGVYSVSTASHGGIMVGAERANELFSDAALDVAFKENGFCCFEEDCANAIALRELLDKHIMITWIGCEPDKLAAAVNESIQHFYPEYWTQREKALGTPDDEKSDAAAKSTLYAETSKAQIKPSTIAELRKLQTAFAREQHHIKKEFDMER